MPRRVPAFSETDPEIALRWAGNVAPGETRTPDQFSAKARLLCWWWCGRDGHDRFAAQPRDADRCPDCTSEREREHQRLMATPVAEVPELVAAWRDSRPYAGLVVADLTYWAGFVLRCPEGHKVDKFARVLALHGCPWCRGNATRRAPRRPLSEADPEVAATWHPTRNGDRTPDNTPEDYRGPLWWKSVQCCGYEWQEDLEQRTLGRRPQAGRGHYYCPGCQAVFGSLAWLDPELAREWHPDNELTPWHVKPFSDGVVVRWRCSTDPTHEWQASVADRSAGRLCPKCSTAGTSSVEKSFCAAAQALDPQAGPGRIGRWRVDVLVPSVRLVIEYDGAYWHRGKAQIDARKTSALIASGYAVARIRENTLPHLPLTSDRLLQVSFHPQIEDVRATTERIFGWASSETVRSSDNSVKGEAAAVEERPHSRPRRGHLRLL